MSRANGIKAGTANLKPVEKGSVRARMLGMKGGLSKSIAKSEAQKLNAIKRRIKREIANPDDAAWLLQKLEHRPSMAADLILYIEKLAQDGGVHPSQRVALAGVMSQAIKSVHGEKIKTENVNINVNTNIEEWEKRLAGVLEKDDEMKE